jgi:hypothetical protein
MLAPSQILKECEINKLQMQESTQRTLLGIKLAGRIELQTEIKVCTFK